MTLSVIVLKLFPLNGSSDDFGYENIANNEIRTIVLSLVLVVMLRM